MLPAPEILIPERREEERNAPHKCPRCESANTKFCYYNNYSRSQPRHFCRSCRRYWTEGGALRNVPVGGIRRNKRRKISPAAIAGGGDIGSHQVFRSPPEPSDSPSDYSIEGLFDSLLPHAPLTFMKDFAGGMAAGSSSSTSSSPSHYSCWGYDIAGGGSEEGLLGMMGPPRVNTWVKEETALPASYWDFWHDVAGFTDAGGR